MYPKPTKEKQKIFSGNAMVSLLLMDLHFLVLFCFKTVTKGYISCQSAFKSLLKRFFYWKFNVSICERNHVCDKRNHSTGIIDTLTIEWFLFS